MATTDLSLVDLINLAVALAILAAGVLSVFYIFYGGISFILSGGQEDKIKQAISTIRYAIIGLFVVIIAITSVRIVGAIFNFDLTSVFSWDRITELMRQVVDRILNTNSGLPGSGSLR